MVYNFSETMQARGEWSKIFSVKRKNPPAYSLYFVHGKISFKNEGVPLQGAQIQPPEWQGALRSYKLHRVAKKKERDREIKTFFAIRLALEEMFLKVLQSEGK